LCQSAKRAEEWLVAHKFERHAQRYALLGDALELA